MNRVLLILGLIGWGLAGVWAQEAPVVQMPLALSDFEGCALQGGILRLPRSYAQPAPRAAIWMEAEEYSQARYRPVLGEDPQASGGRFLARVVRADYNFTLQTAGRYQVWVRALFPHAGSWSHAESMDRILLGGTFIVDSRTTSDSDPDLKRWLWVRCGQYDLAAGDHFFSLNYHGGAQLDKLLITPDLDFTPEGLGEQGRAGGPTQGWAVSSDLQPAAVVRWERFAARLDPKGGKVAVEASADSGRTWSALPADLSLAVFPAAGRGQDRVRFRITLQTGPQGESPTVQEAKVTYASGICLPQPAPLPEPLLDRSQSLPLVFTRITQAAEPEPEGRAAQLVDRVQLPDGNGVIWFTAAEGIEAGLRLSRTLELAPDQPPEHVGALFFPPNRHWQLRYRFHLPQEEEVTVWLRARLGDRMYLRHLQAFDHGKLQQIGPPPSTGPDWQWYPGLTQRLDGGNHSLTLQSVSYALFGLNWSTVDRVAISPNGTEPPGEPGAPWRGPVGLRGVAETFPVQVPVGARPQRLTWKAEGRVRAFLSGDGGKAWQESADGDFSAVPVEPAEALLVKFELNNAGRVSDAAITYSTPAEPFARLSNAAMDLYLAPRTAEIAGLYDRLNQRWVVPLGTRRSFLALDWRPPGEPWTSTLQAKDGILIEQETLSGAQAPGLRLTYSLMDDTLRATCTISLAQQNSRWDIEVHNRGNLEIRRVQFPALGPLRLSGDGRGDMLMWPFPYGIRLQNPSRDSFKKLTHPGDACMGWTDLYDDRGGVYLALTNSDLLGTELEYLGSPESGSVDLSLAKQIYIPPGGTWAGSYRLAVHRGDWHWGADQYRAWLATWLKPPQHPDWLRDCPGIGDFALTSDLWPARYDEAALRARLLGSNYIQHWGVTGEAESCGFLPYLNPRLGTPEQFAAGHKASAALGVHHTYYMNCQGWVPGFSQLDRLGFVPRSLFPEDLRLEPPDFYLENAPYGLDGEPVPEGPGLNWTTEDRVMCCAAAGWREHLRYWMVEQYAKNFRTSGTYLDQTAVVAPKQCWKSDHGHDNQHGYWGKGLTELLEQVVTQARQTNPDYIVGMEGASDAMGQWGGYHLWNGDPDVFLYTCPWAVPMVDIVHFDTRVIPYWQEFVRHYWMAGRLWGSRFEDWCYSKNKWEEARVMNNTLRDCLNLKNWMAPWLREARYMDTVGLTVSDARVEARWFALGGGDRGAVINLHNEDRRRDTRTTLSTPVPLGQVGVALAYTPEGVQKLAVEQESRQVSFVAPAEPICSVLLLAQNTGDWVSLTAVQPWTEGSPRIAAHLVNLRPQGPTCKGSLQLQATPDLGLPSRSRQVELPPGEPVTVNLEMPELASLRRPGFVMVSFDGDSPGATTVQEVLVWPTLWNTGFEDDQNRDGHPDGWGILDWGLYHVFARHTHDRDISGLFGTRDGEAAAGEWCLRRDPPVPHNYDFLVGDPSMPHFHDQVKDGKWVRRAIQQALPAQA